MRHNKRKIYFRNIYKSDLYDCLKRNAKGTHLYTVDGLINGGGGALISGWAYGFYPGSLKLGDFKVGFYGIHFGSSTYPGQLIIIEKENGTKIGVWLKMTKLHVCYGGVLNA